MARKFQALTLTDEAANIITDNATEVGDLNREQLYKGLDANGQFLSPKYSEDPFFKTREAAERYAQWKMRITPDPDRPKDVPNLYITGRYHESRQVKVEGNKLVFLSDDPNASKIKGKYRNIDGLTMESIYKFRAKTLYPRLVRVISEKTGAGIGTNV
ncbi:MAG TPA: hypothetical protein VIM64_11510 [Puia sp.]